MDALVALTPLVLGTISGLTTRRDVWYENLKKPKVQPPPWTFGVAWTILYLLMGVALVLALKNKMSKGFIIGLFVFQLALNLLWSPIFFRWHKIGMALALIFVLLVSVVAMTIIFWKQNTIAGMLLVPYVLWLVFATYLNAEIYVLNK